MIQKTNSYAPNHFGSWAKMQIAFDETISLVLIISLLTKITVITVIQLDIQNPENSLVIKYSFFNPLDYSF